MTGIAGITGNHSPNIVTEMLDKIQHRGKQRKLIKLKNNISIGFVYNNLDTLVTGLDDSLDFSYSPDNDSSAVTVKDGKITLKRDKLGAEPLYFVILPEESLAFASEIKALTGFGVKIHELEPGHILEDMKIIKYFELKKAEPLPYESDELATLIKEVLLKSILKKINGGTTGAWLSGGLDSSVISALARPFIKDFHTFSAGFPNAPDLQYAKVVAGFIGSKHFERVITFPEVIKILPEVIYHLESFDELLVRSSVMNYLVAQLASDYVENVFSGEGGDELFAGYSYLKELPTEELEDELIEITRSLHNTALQRVDRSSSAFGTTAFTPFTDEEVVNLAIQIPVKFKIFGSTEKWILRSAIMNDLPYNVLMRTKSKFWEGSGIGERICDHAEKIITDSEFTEKRKIRCGWELKSKEELFYYRIFSEQFGDLDYIDWMGRSRATVPAY